MNQVDGRGTRPLLAEICGVRSPGGRAITRECSSWISVAWHRHQLNTERLVYPISCRLHGLLLDHAKIMHCKDAAQSALSIPMPMMSTSPPTFASALMSSARSSMLLSCRLKSSCLVSVTRSLISRWMPVRGFSVGRDAEPGEERIHGPQGIRAAAHPGMSAP